MKKFKVFFNIEKEEQWLNKQLEKGYRCTHVSSLGIYTFEKTDKSYVLRLDYQERLTGEKLEEYKGVYEDFGWCYIKSTPLNGVRYWQKENDHRNEIFSDRESKANYYKRLMQYSFWLGTMCLTFAFLLYSDTELYHESIWRMEGSLFWKAFIFETPFALLKLTPLLLVGLFSSSYYTAYKQHRALKET
ncbi:hypothetical protein KP77_06980 [Jeotgalibacillus alimentarius]|uniref:DUF2812 domain-containing protein n=1 Tax=Jeotgalibacillus alimentarius TaxID=135826 RepID=A0A0C2RPL4_9BACL|nr:DUF2812 domain-containing protein [Jeotgalibacillus alimentarius]KIL52225.1 hypothetical protein KP77_06980 [Jeotgalibacillus alimentarius]